MNDTATSLDTGDRRPTPAQWFLVAFVSGAPLLLALVVSALRHDLIAPMLGHVFGFLLAGAFVLLVFGALAISWVGTLWSTRAPTPRSRRLRQAAATLVPLLLCTAPACFAALFGPIVFALLYGTVR